MAIIGGLCPWLDEQLHDDNGDPLAGGFVEFFVSGTSTHKDTFSTSDLDPTGVNSNPVQLDSAGRPPVSIFLEAGGYDANIYDANMVLVNSITAFEDIGQTLLASFGQTNVSGARNVVSGYLVLDSDNLITVDGSGGPDPTIINLQAVVDRTQTLVVKNVGSTGVSLVPNGTDTIELSLASYALAAASGPIFPTVTLGPSVDDSSYLILSDHGFA